MPQQDIRQQKVLVATWREFGRLHGSQCVELGQRNRTGLNSRKKLSGHLPEISKLLRSILCRWTNRTLAAHKVIEHFLLAVCKSGIGPRKRSGFALPVPSTPYPVHPDGQMASHPKRRRHHDGAGIAAVATFWTGAGVSKTLRTSKLGSPVSLLG